MVAPLDWTDALTLAEYVGRLFQEGKVGSAEFRVLVRIYGKAKIDEYLKKSKEPWKRRNKKGPFWVIWRGPGLILDGPI